MKLLFFRASWCQACHAIEDRIPVQHDTIDIENGDMGFGVCSLPTFIAVNDDGLEVGRVQTTDMKALEKWYDSISNN
jgi:translation elongation factor EF-1beta